MRESLLVRTDLIPTLNDVNTLITEYTDSFVGGLEIEIEDSIMILFLRPIDARIISIVLFESLVIKVRSFCRMHVRRIKNHTFN
ncbi:MAG TPA: hypothetical protein VLK33_04450 [Terriglobales bacterium]|nr:hypothetical protein [Terriglobales bacterium]